MIKKISISAALLSIVFMCACSDGTAGAAGDYVKASGDAQKAVEAFANADYSEAAALAESAEKQIRSIIEKHPDSDVSFKIVSDETIRLGSMRYGDFRGRFLPEAAAVADADMKPFDLAWAISYAGNQKRDAQINAFALYASHYQRQIAILGERGLTVKAPLSSEASMKMAQKAASYIKASEIRAAVERSIAQDLEKRTRVKIQPANPRPSKLHVPIDNPEKFLAEAQREAGRVVYNVEAANRLLAMSESALANEGVRAQFGEILKTALDSAQKISSRKMHNSAVVAVVEALSIIGFNDDALVGTMYIDGDTVLKAVCLEKIAYSCALHGNFDGALSIVYGFAESPKKTEMLSRLCADLVRSEMTGKALEVAAKIRDVPARSTALTTIAGAMWLKDNAKAFELLKQVNPVFLSERTLADFCVMADLDLENFINADVRKLSMLCLIAAEILPKDRDVFARWESAAMRSYQSVNNPHELASAARLLALLEFKAGKNDEVLNIVFGVIKKADPQSMFVVLCDLGLEAGLRGDEALSSNIFANAASVAKSPALEKSLPSNAIYLAWQIQLSGMARPKAVEMLGDFLPKYGN